MKRKFPIAVPSFLDLPEGEVTLAILKPDVIRRSLLGDLDTMISEGGLTILAKDMKVLTTSDIEFLYGEHIGKDFYPRTKDFMVSGPSVVLALALTPAQAQCMADARNSQRWWREIMMPCIRAKFSAPGRPQHENLVHGSDSYESARKELCWFFGK